jgi:ferredoxin
VCSTTGRGLQPAILEAGLEGFWTPLLDARNGYCEYTCALCGQICPTGAIAPLPLEKKKVTRIGLAYFDRSRCIPWYRNEDCLVCEEHCPTPDKAIVFRLEEGILLDGQKRLVKRPYVREDLCIGCGICVTRCPVKGEPGVFLTNAQEQRGEKGKGPERETPAGGRVETSKSRRGGMRKGVSEGFLAS